MSDRGARNLSIVFLAVWGSLTLFYAFLAWRSLTWSPAFFIKNANSERSKVILVSEMKLPTLPTMNTADRIPSSFSLAIKRGKSLYLRSGCALCHGPDGKGGVKNKNYIKDTIPALNTLAEKMLIWEKSDAEKIISLLASNKSLEAAEDVDLSNVAAVVAQYISVRDVVEGGQIGGKKDPSGSSPLDMPEWKQRLSRKDINLIIAYLLSLYQWEEEG